MEVDEIEYKIANNELSAAQVFTQMKQHTSSEVKEWFYSGITANGVEPSGVFVGKQNETAHEAISRLREYLKSELGRRVNITTFNRC